jgi:hypothetical protein
MLTFVCLIHLVRRHFQMWWALGILTPFGLHRGHCFRFLASMNLGFYAAPCIIG